MENLFFGSLPYYKYFPYSLIYKLNYFKIKLYSNFFFFNFHFLTFFNLFLLPFINFLENFIDLVILFRLEAKNQFKFQLLLNFYF